MRRPVPSPRPTARPGARRSRPRRRTAAATLALATVAAFSAACISDAPTAPPPADFQVDCATDVQPPQGSGQAVVRIRNFAFEPAELTVAVGTEVTWVNCEGAGGPAHTSTSDDEIWDSGLLSPDMGEYRRTFEVVGSFDYHCTPHPFMQATVVVE